MKLKISIMALLLTLFTLCSFACKKKDDIPPESSSTSASDSTSTGSEGEITIYLSTTMELLEYTSKEIAYEVIGGEGKDFIWTTSDPSVATVSDGEVTGIKEGTAHVTLSVGGKSATCAVTVTKNYFYPVIELHQEDVRPRVGGSVELWADIRFNDQLLGYTEFTWSSADASIATVENGVVTGVAAGETTITVETNYNGILLKKTIAVTVVAVA